MKVILNDPELVSTCLKNQKIIISEVRIGFNQSSAISCQIMEERQKNGEKALLVKILSINKADKKVISSSKIFEG